MTDAERTFLIDLEALSRKHGMVIFGCGCCGSPSIEQLKPEGSDPKAGYAYSDHIRWVAPSDSYEWDNFSSDIAK